MTLKCNKVKKFYGDGNFSLVPCDRRKLKKLKRKNEVLEFGRVGPYWSINDFSAYHWSWKYFNGDVIPSNETIYFCKNFTNKKYLDTIKSRVTEYGLSPEQHTDSFFVYYEGDIPHNITNEAYLIFKNKKELTKWKLTH